MSMPPVDTTLPTNVPVAGKASYGTPLYKSIHENWIERIAQPFAISHFTYSVASPIDSPLYSIDLTPSTGSTSSLVPFFIFFISNYQYFKCSFSIVLRAIKHSSHRGAIAVTTTLNDWDTSNRLKLYGPTRVWEINGAETSQFEYEIPNVYAFGSKIAFEKARINKTNSVLFVPKYAWNLCKLTVSAVTPLVSSTILPDTISIIAMLKPDISTLEVSHPVNPSIHRLNAGRITEVWDNV